MAGFERLAAASEEDCPVPFPPMMLLHHDDELEDVLLEPWIESTMVRPEGRLLPIVGEER